MLEEATMALTAEAAAAAADEAAEAGVSGSLAPKDRLQL